MTSTQGNAPVAQAGNGETVCPECSYDAGDEFILTFPIPDSKAFGAIGEPSAYTNWCPRCNTEWFIPEPLTPGNGNP